MKNKQLLIVFAIIFSLLCGVVWVQAASKQENGRSPTLSHPTDIYAGRTANRAVVSTENLAIFGPLSCTSFGDPWSPLVYNWPGSSGVEHSPTYHFRIRIPASYPYDILRVELFDPDSYNVAGITADVAHTQAWIDSGRPAVETLSCPNGGPSSQVNPCLIETSEDELLGLPIDQVNPWWLMRIDENRYGNGTGTGCNIPSNYTPAYNTQTLYQLYYYQETDTNPLRAELAAYTGQVNDGVRDNGEHDTDLRWVSPGGGQSWDQSVFVPSDFGSFEISLSNDLIDIITDPITGDRYVYMDITAVDGSSENGFHIWAGPNIYTNSLPSDVNYRNMQQITSFQNSAIGMDTYGVQVFAQDYLPVNSDYPSRLSIPLADIGPEYAGQTISVGLFDPDSGAQPPVVFYFDTLAFTPDNSANQYDENLTDWALAFAVTGVPDPDGSTGRCDITGGSCNNSWISPTYQIQIPTLDTEACLASGGSDQSVCTPFYGGRLMAYYRGGSNDSYQWEIHTPEPPPLNTTTGCTAFPVSPYLDIRSLTDPGGSNPYPDPADFDYPNDPPAYEDFIYNMPDIPLVEAQEGYIYLIEDTSGAGLGWLVWNDGIAATANTLEDSLQWPGNTTDYTDHADGGQPATPLYPWVVRGYVNPIDNLDLTLQVDDWVVAQTGSVNSAGIQAVLAEHIDLDRVLRLPVWNDVNGSGGSSMFEVAGFINVRLRGYHLSQSGGDSWLLVEVMGWDTSCGQMAQVPQSVTIDGPVLGQTGQGYEFSAISTPLSTTLPLLYTWQATDQTPITQTADLTTQITFTWATPGNKTITVTASNSYGTVTDTHTIQLEASPINLIIGNLELLGQIPPPPNQPIQVQMTITNTGGFSVNQQFFVDVFFDPAAVYTDHIPIDYSAGYVAIGSLGAGDSQVVTVTAPAGFSTTGQHLVYGMVDSLQSVGEAVETDNIVGPLMVTVVSPADLVIGHLHMLTEPPLLPYQPVDWQVTITNTGSVSITNPFFVDFFFDPPVVYSHSIPITYSVGYVAVGSLAGETSQVLTVTTPIGFTTAGQHLVYAMVDSEEGVDEADESNNISGPLTVTVEVEPVAITAVSLQGASAGGVGETYTFTAAITPTTATQPITYTWQISGEPPITHTGGLTDTIGLSWAVAGTYTITITAENGIGSPVTATHTITITTTPPPQWHIYLPLMSKN